MISPVSCIAATSSSRALAPIPLTDIALAARPAIFVPYPFHRDRQQEHNAKVLERVGGAVI